MNLKQIYYDKLKRWYHSQSMMEVWFDGMLGCYVIVDTSKSNTVAYANDILYAYEKAMAYSDAKEDMENDTSGQT